MAVIGLDHINIKAPAALLRECRDFYVDVLGLTEGARPDFFADGYWLYANGKAVVHLSVKEDQTSGPSYYNHVAFQCVDIESVVARLQARAIDYTLKTTPDEKSRQLFVYDPCQLRVELNQPR